MTFPCSQHENVGMGGANIIEPVHRSYTRAITDLGGACHNQGRGYLSHMQLLGFITIVAEVECSVLILLLHRPELCHTEQLNFFLLCK